VRTLRWRRRWATICCAGGEASLIKRIIAVLVGAVVAGFAFSTFKLIIYRPGLGNGDWNRSISALLIDGLILSVAYGLILLAIAIMPFWRTVEAICFSDWWRGPFIGAGLTVAVWLAVISSGRYGWARADQTLALLVCAMVFSNAVGGLSIWRLLKTGRAAA
jgi:hypothetical protein